MEVDATNLTVPQSDALIDGFVVPQVTMSTFTLPIAVSFQSADSDWKLYVQSVQLYDWTHHWTSLQWYVQCLYQRFV